MAQTTAPTAISKDFLNYGDIIFAQASGNLTATKGDWLAFSGAYVVAANTGVAGFKASGAGVALGQNPYFDEFGTQRTNTAIPILTRGIIRVSACTSGYSNSAGFNLGVPMAPASTASGIVGQTGATGVGPSWINVPLVGVSAAIGALTALIPSGVGTYVNFVKGGDISASQVDVYIHGLGQRPDYI